MSGAAAFDLPARSEGAPTRLSEPCCFRCAKSLTNGKNLSLSFLLRSSFSPMARKSQIQKYSSNWISTTAMRQAPADSTNWPSRLRYIFDPIDKRAASAVILSFYDTFANRTIEVHKQTSKTKQKLFELLSPDGLIGLKPWCWMKGINSDIPQRKFLSTFKIFILTLYDFSPLNPVINDSIIGSMFILICKLIQHNQGYSGPSSPALAPYRTENSLKDPQHNCVTTPQKPRPRVCPLPQLRASISKLIPPTIKFLTNLPTSPWQGSFSCFFFSPPPIPSPDEPENLLLRRKNLKKLSPHSRRRFLSCLTQASELLQTEMRGVMTQKKILKKKNWK